MTGLTKGELDREKEFTSIRKSESRKTMLAKKRGGAALFNTSVAPGVYPLKRSGDFKAVYGKPCVVIGYFPTLEEAKAARAAYIAKLG